MYIFYSGARVLSRTFLTPYIHRGYVAGGPAPKILSSKKPPKTTSPGENKKIGGLHGDSLLGRNSYYTVLPFAFGTPTTPPEWVRTL